MSDEIVSRLMKKHRKIKFLAEDVKYLREADEDEDDFEDAPGADEEYADLTKDEDASEESPEETSEDSDDMDGTDEEEVEHDDSQAPIQGNPGVRSHASMGDMGGEESPEGEEEPPMPEDEPEEEEPDENPTEYENPLDNQYAVHFTLGDEVNLTAKGTKNSDVKKGVIEGYDPEGFYKVKWDDESTTNGLTDIALEQLVKTMKENKCVCGSHKFVTENKEVICDRCGRKIRENTLDALTLADKSRPKGKRMIRSEAHPVSTANRPNIDIAETIRKAFKGVSLTEEDDPEEGSAYDRLKSLDNQFWTRQNEMQEDIEDLGYTVEEINSEYIVVSSDEDEEYAYKIPVEGTSRTMTLDFSRAKMI